MTGRFLPMQLPAALRGSVARAGGPTIWLALLASYFIVSLLLDRLSGWHVGSVHALLAATVLAALAFREQPRSLALFFVLLLAAIAWMSFRDVVNGAGWKASERTLKAALLVLGMLACCRLSLPAWRLTLPTVIASGLVIMIAYIGPEQFIQALLKPFELAAREGLVTHMNRNGLALPLGLLTCWTIAGVFLLRPAWLWPLPASALLVLMIANGSRNALVALVVAVLVMLFSIHPRKVLYTGLAVLTTGLLIHYFLPDYWLHNGTFFNQRDVIWGEVFRHLPEHLWQGAGSAYFRQSITPGLPAPYVIAHNAYLDFLLAYGLIGVLLLTAAGVALARVVQVQSLNPQAIWLCASFSFLTMFGLFDRGHLDALMLAAMLMLPTMFMMMGSAAIHRWIQPGAELNR